MKKLTSFIHAIISLIILLFSLPSYADFPTTTNNGYLTCNNSTQIITCANPNGSNTFGSFSCGGQSFNLFKNGGFFVNTAIPCNTSPGNTGCPANATKINTNGVTTCSCNAGYTQDGSSCVEGEPEPEPNTCESGQRQIFAVQNSTGTCTDPDDCLLKRTTYNDMPSFMCGSNNCQYDKKYGDASLVHECYRNLTDSIAYCDITYISNGDQCNDISVQPSTSNPNNQPISTTPNQTEANNSSNSGSSTPSIGGSSSGGTGTKGGQGTGSSPNSGSNPNQPTGGNDATGNENSSIECPDCATEDTAQNIADALRNTDGSVDAPDVSDVGIGNGDIADIMTGDDKIRNVFTFKIPAHNRTCPTASIPMDFFGKPAITFDTHCNMLNPFYDYLRSIAMIAWLLMAMLRILEA